jgi:hypothetical protein
MTSSQYRGLAQVYFGLLIVLGGLMLRVTLESARALGVDIIRSNWLLLILLQVGALALAVGGLAVGFNRRWDAAAGWLMSPAPTHAFVRLGGVVLLVASFAFILLARQFFAGYFIDLHIPTLWLAGWGSLLGAAGLRLLTRQPWAFALAGMLLLVGVLAKVVSLSTAISDSPFSLGWSEASRFYYASLFFAEKLYGEPLPLSILHPTRYFLQSFPFIFDDLPILAHRAWQVFLWVVLTACAAWSLVRRLEVRPVFAAWLAGAWFFLYLFQGAVYYHLLVMVILVLWGTSTRHPWQTLFVVLVASLWAGVSRVNWFPVPALLAAALYFLEQPVQPDRRWMRYLAWPVVWFLAGVAVALAAQSAYIFLSGNANNAEAFGPVSLRTCCGIGCGPAPPIRWAPYRAV